MDGGAGSTVVHMRCPFCEADDDKVVDSRPADEGAAVRRRRECLTCGRRYTTYERVDELPLLVVKRSGARDPFDVEKVRSGIERAVAGGPIAPAAVDALAVAVEEAARAKGHEVTSEWVGRTVLEWLSQLDPVSAVRFASVYKGFDDLGDFEREVVELQKSTAPKVRGR
jgi:transcriptional repressor NrdR